MPAPGDQHVNAGVNAIRNPFEEAKPRLSEYTAQEIATLQSRLDKQLGPEYISSRAGPSGHKLHYLAAETCIQLANEVFGFNGWSSQVMDITVDFADENPTTLKINLGVSVIVRVSLRDGTFHEDIGYGHIENCKGKAAAFEKAKKQGTTDGLKRALRNFGNVLGNCIYDKEYLSKVTKVKVPPTKWDVERLHRRSAPVSVKGEPEGSKAQEEKYQNDPTGASIISGDALDDEFGDFDEADFSVPEQDCNPDEVVLPAPVSNQVQNGNATAGPTANRAIMNQSRPNFSHGQPKAAPTRPPTIVQGPDGGRNAPPQPQPRTPNSGFARFPSGGGLGIQMRPPPQDSGPPARTIHPGNQGPGRVLNQPSRTEPAAVPISHAILSTSSDDSGGLATDMPPQGPGFFSARAASMIPDGANTDTIPPPHTTNNLPVFNPHAESPSIRKTPGIDHKMSKPLTKDLKHVPGSTQHTNGSGSRTNMVNPQLDVTRRIGAPGNSSPIANRSMYKPPTLKRPVDGGATGGGVSSARVPLVDLPTNEGMGTADVAGDAKRQRLNG